MIQKGDYFVNDENTCGRIKKMIVMDVRLDNFFAFKNFHINMSYPKKIADSCIENEFLTGYPNFRYKKVMILMGANATGKTSFGKMLMKIFNFMDKKEHERLTSGICDKTQKAFFSIDFVGEEDVLYRVETTVRPQQGERYSVSDIDVQVRSVNILKRDSYETCASRFEQTESEQKSSYIEELEKVDGLSWLFKYPNDELQYGFFTSENEHRYLKILECVLRALDPSVLRVSKIESVKEAYVIETKSDSVIIQSGKKVDTDLLSSGTKAGIDVAEMVASIIEEEYRFYYCDEKFSYIHSDIEKAFLAVMIEALGENNQLFFTTHNTDILDMPLPKHSFVFLRKDVNNEEMPIACVSASSLLKRSTDSLKRAVENDLFSVAPATDMIYEIMEL